MAGFGYPGSSSSRGAMAKKGGFINSSIMFFDVNVALLDDCFFDRRFEKWCLSSFILGGLGIGFVFEGLFSSVNYNCIQVGHFSGNKVAVALPIIDPRNCNSGRSETIRNCWLPLQGAECNKNCFNYIPIKTFLDWAIEAKLTRWARVDWSILFHFVGILRLGWINNGLIEKITSKKALNPSKRILKQLKICPKLYNYYPQHQYKWLYKWPPREPQEFQIDSLMTNLISRRPLQRHSNRCSFPGRSGRSRPPPNDF